MKTLAIIVNYKVAALTIEAAHSVLISDSLGRCQVVVVDNSEAPQEEKMLRASLPENVELLILSENLGFGRACNLALKRFSGDLILLLNPDARLLPGCLFRLQKTLLDKKKVAAVGPQVFWDDNLNYYLPPPCPPFMFLFASVMASISPQSWIKRLINRAWRRHAIKIWRSEGPIKVGNLSGGHVLLKRDAVEQAGGLFDPKFFLYFEDTDLFIRLKQAGYGLIFDTRAKVVHYYDQCGQHDIGLKRELSAQSHNLFLRKYLLGGKLYLHRLLKYFASHSKRKTVKRELPFFTAPFSLDVPLSAQRNWLFEWSPSPEFIPAVGMFGQGEYFNFSAKYWNMLAPGRYYGRLGAPGIGDVYCHQICWEIKA